MVYFQVLSKTKTFIKNLLLATGNKNSNIRIDSSILSFSPIVGDLPSCLPSSEAVVQRCSVEKGFLRNFEKFTGKQLFQSLFFNKVAVRRPAILLKERLWHRCFPVNFAKFLRTPFSTEHLQWLLLQVR